MNVFLLKILSKSVFVPLALLLNVLHPLLHPFEGGGLDGFIEWVNMMAFVEASR